MFSIDRECRPPYTRPLDIWQQYNFQRFETFHLGKQTVYLRQCNGVILNRYLHLYVLRDGRSHHKGLGLRKVLKKVLKKALKKFYLLKKGLKKVNALF